MLFNIEYHSETKEAPQPEWSIGQLTEVFKSFDKDKDGKLSKHELRAAFNYLGARFSYFRTLMACYNADDNKDGFINLHNDEFSTLVKYAHSCGYKVDK